MYRLIYAEFENFIGLYNGLGKKKVILDLKEYRDKTMFVILGGNAKGKSTLMSVLHPFSGTTDKRNKFIREDKEGYKLLVYEDINDPEKKIKVKHVYVPNKSGSHSTKSFIHKIVNGKELDLNPNGNVSSFLLAIEQEFGITEDFLRLSTQSEDMVGLVKMSSAERKDHIYKFIPKADDTTIYQKVIAKKYRDVKTYLSSIIDKLGKMDDEVTVKEMLRKIESLTNELVEKRDKTIGKINKYKAELNNIDPDGKLESEFKQIKLDLKDMGRLQEKLLSKIQDYRSRFDIDSLNECNKRLEELATTKNKLWELIVQLRSSTNSKRLVKQTLYDQLEEKKQILNQLTSVNSKEDIDRLLKEYEKKLNDFDKRLEKINTSLTSDDLIRGIDILEHLREFLYDLYNSCSSKKVMEQACEVIFDKSFEAQYLESKEELEKIKEKIISITSNIDKLSAYEYLKDSANKRPKECTIDTCGFLQDYHKWIAIEKKIKEFETDLKEVNEDYQKLMDKTERYYEVAQVKMKLENLITFYRSNHSLITRLPFNDKYVTEEKLLKRIKAYDTLVGVEEPFYEIIEILQQKSEYEEIRRVKIPNLKIELERINNNHGLLKSIEKDITKLTANYEKIVEELKSEDKELERMEEEFEKIENKEGILKELKEYLVKIQENKEEIIKLSNKFETLKSTIARASELKEKLEERQAKLKVIESKLRPLTETRDKYKYQEIKIKEYNMEKQVLEKNLKILELIRNALSTNKGMPVSILGMYVEEIRKSANLLLSETFDGTLYLESFEINEKEFAIPMQHNGERNSDISKGSSSERAFISSCLSMAIIEQIIANYGILNIDEGDATLSSDNKAIYFHILTRQIKRIGIPQVFMITHSREYFEPYKSDVCFILFPDHNLNKEKFDYIKIY